MKTLDLHGVRHKDVERLVENFVLCEDTPVKIITGNSPAMRSIVEDVLDQHGFSSSLESFWNLGSLIVNSKHK